MPDTPLVDQPTSAPTRKVVASTVGAAFATVMVLGAVWVGASDPPIGFEGGLATVMTFVLGYFTRDRAS